MVSNPGNHILISLEPPKNKENVTIKNLKLSSVTPKYGTLLQITQLILLKLLLNNQLPLLLMPLQSGSNYIKMVP